MDVVIVFGNGVGDRLEKHGLAGFRWGDDQATLPAPDGGHQVDDATGDIRGYRFQVKHLARENWCQNIKMWTELGDFGVYPVNSFDTQQTIILFVVFRRSNLARNHVTCTQTEA